MTVYSHFTDVINNGNFDLPTITERINYYHINGNLTNEERESLLNLARQAADPTVDLNIMTKLYEVDGRVHELENEISTLSAALTALTTKVNNHIAGNDDVEPNEPTGETPEEYVQGKWYYAGDKVTFNGEVYECIAPEGTVCVWSPADYPSYWSLIN